MKELIRSKLQDSIDLKTSLLTKGDMLATVEKIAQALIDCFKQDGKVLWCGNGGSAADAQHLAAEFTGKYYYDRPPLFSEALHVNASYVTAVANDYSYEEIYARLTKAMGRKGDVLIGLSTSGNSENVVRALKVANEIGMVTIGFTGEGGGKMKEHCKYLLAIPSKDTPRIQECHMLFGHSICELVEASLFPKK